MEINIFSKTIINKNSQRDVKIMEAAWQLQWGEGPTYRGIVKKYPDSYGLRGGHVYSKASNEIIARMKFPGRPFSKTNLMIRHNFKDSAMLEESLKLARLLEEEGCNDFDEYPSRQLLEVISKNRFTRECKGVSD